MGLLDRFKKSSKNDTVAVTKPSIKSTAKPVAKTVVPKEIIATKTQAQTAVSATDYTAVLIRPIVTEKSTATGTYNFKVAKAASKNEIAKAFKIRYGKKPRRVNIVNVLGKTKFRGRTAGKRADWKKAVIYLNKGETVDTSK
ncbi:MAG: 50S ribosomal protein L23 [uncultured bacterium]|nr:MAG: 50S ribosomal protein L23 [uncultured bacterium]